MYEKCHCLEIFLLVVCWMIINEVRAFTFHSSFPSHLRLYSTETTLLPQQVKIDYPTLLGLYLKVTLFSVGSSVLFRKVVSSCFMKHISVLKFFIMLFICLLSLHRVFFP